MPRTKKTVVIIISGKAGSGKSTLADMMVSKLRDIPSMRVMQYGFADPIKYMAKAFGKWDGQKDEAGRTLLQKIGQIFRDYNQNIWVIHFLNQLDKQAGLLPFNFVVISDWRFPNEYAHLLNNPLLDVVTIRVYGRGGLDGQVALDVSENSLPEAVGEYLGEGMYIGNELYQYAIENVGGIDLLEIKLDTVLADIQKKFVIE